MKRILIGSAILFVLLGNVFFNLHAELRKKEIKQEEKPKLLNPCYPPYHSRIHCTPLMPRQSWAACLNESQRELEEWRKVHGCEK